jgi:ABC-type cobalamin/Fe3+-siderophores transport system ATPase subunit
LAITLGEGEPPAGPWRVVPFDALIAMILAHGPTPAGRPMVVAVDGRAGSGKSTLAQQLCRAHPNAAVVHTDDLIGHSFFGWTELLIDGVLRPLRIGGAANYLPPCADLHGRRRPITLAPGTELVLLEGVGASRPELGPWIDRSIWVQADVNEAERRWVTRDGGPEVVGSLRSEWMSEEVAFLAHDRPWERASVIVAGTASEPYDRNAEVLVVTALLSRSALG